MILHLGNDSVVYEKDIIIIIDANITEARNNKEFWDKAQLAESPAEDGEQPKSFVVAANGGDYIVYPSPISSQTLWKRINSSEYSGPVL